MLLAVVTRLPTSTKLVVDPLHQLVELPEDIVADESVKPAVLGRCLPGQKIEPVIIQHAGLHCFPSH